MANAENPLTFVPAELAHLPDMVRNETRSYAFPWTEGVFRDCIAGPQSCWVAQTEDGLVIGHAIVGIAAGEAHLLNICISRDQQGYGYGREFLLFLLRHIADSGAEVLFLEVRPSNRVAIALYQSLGFREIGVRKDYYPAPFGREDAQVLALQFPTPAQTRPLGSEIDQQQAQRIVESSTRDPNEARETTTSKRDHFGAV